MITFVMEHDGRYMRKRMCIYIYNWVTLLYRTLYISYNENKNM